MKYNSVALDQVSLKDSFLINAFYQEVRYLKSLDVDRLVSGFYTTKGLTAKAEQYEGWESSEIQGHTLGHYLTALSQAFLLSSDTDLGKKIEYIINELSICQHKSGYLSAFNEVLFDRLENKEPAWVPWYTMHKILSGLISVYYLKKDLKSFHIITKLANWISNRVNNWSDEIQKRVLAVEYGGMNDCLYETFLITKNKNHLKAAHQFDELSLFKSLANKDDILNNLHANTTIPKFIGAMKRVMVTDDTDFYLEAAENFWDIVINHHTYITGGNSEWEHFGEADILDSERSNCTCETCNTYNMLKLSKGLFMLTGKSKYLNYYENTFNNAILPSQNPETGMTMYFQPMATGYFKTFGEPFENFWCCTGSGMENFTKLNDGILYFNEEELIIARYASFDYKWHDKSISLSLDVEFLKKSKFKVILETFKDVKESYVNLKFHIPSWVKGNVVLGRSSLSSRISQDFLELSGIVSGCIEIEVDFPMELTLHNLCDSPNTYAFKYGPNLLSACLGRDNMEISKTGVDVTIPTKNIEIDDFFIVNNIEDWIKKTVTVKPVSGEIPEYYISDENNEYKFIPHYLQYKERYGIYWRLIEKDSSELKKYQKRHRQKALFECSIIDKIPLGNDQYELEHNIYGENTISDTRDGYRHREILPNGELSYLLRVNPELDNYLEFKYSLSGIFSFNVIVDNVIVSEVKNTASKGLDYLDKQLILPKSSIMGKDEIKVCFKNSGGEPFRIVDLLLTRKVSNK
ncbi:MAG: glycoside hydrolase family 127 protein [Spirochaetaceae bacterium]